MRVATRNALALLIVVEATESIVLGGGCFWCLEAVFQRIPGVVGVTPGYAGGSSPNPTYHDVCSGETGHAEVVRVEYDPSVISLADVMDWFFRCHDPTTMNRQGADTGTQYRSIVLFSRPDERLTVEAARENAQRHLADRIVTEIVPLVRFYPAERAHFNYFNENGRNGYCQYVIQPKLARLGLAG